MELIWLTAKQAQCRRDGNGEEGQVLEVAIGLEALWRKYWGARRMR